MGWPISVLYNFLLKTPCNHNLKANRTKLARNIKLSFYHSPGFFIHFESKKEGKDQELI